MRRSKKGKVDSVAFGNSSNADTLPIECSWISYELVQFYIDTRKSLCNAERPNEHNQSKVHPCVVQAFRDDIEKRERLADHVGPPDAEHLIPQTSVSSRVRACHHTGIHFASAPAPSNRQSLFRGLEVRVSSQNPFDSSHHVSLA